ncbi:hypothetical protein ACC706_38085, partial [Rhizobium johnstonii]
VKLAKVQGQLAWHSHRDEDYLDALAVEIGDDAGRPVFGDLGIFGLDRAGVEAHRQTLSINVAVPMPAPMQSVTSAVLRSR